MDRDQTAYVLQEIARQYGYDFSDYHPEVMGRRLEHIQSALNVSSVAELLRLIIQNENVFQKILTELTIDVSWMFRDIEMFKCFREYIVPRLSSFPRIRIWVAGCASGQEAYSLAILLKEVGLYDKSLIYATDINKASLIRARKGLYPIAEANEYARRYRSSGGTESFGDYITVGSKNISIKDHLKKNIVFSHHNLVCDGVFNQFEVILCCNVLIYFSESLKNRALKLFDDSLKDFGFLVIGSEESIRGRCIEKDFERPQGRINIYKRKGRFCEPAV